MPTPYKHSNGRLALRRGNGTFRRATLQDFGIPKAALATGPMTCADCGHTWNPIMKDGYCPNCNSQKKFDANECQCKDENGQPLNQCDECPR